MNGIIVINKPTDFTSFDVVAVVRKITKQKKLGHTGTLDPNATGVLPILLGNATKAQDVIFNHDKSYIAEFKLGLTTDTLDIWGKITSENPTNIAKTDIEKIIPNFTGEISQIPPMYSAIKINGQRLYDLARNGVEVERKSRNITIYRLLLRSFNEQTQTGKIEVDCSKGTYIRTLIDDIGKALGTGAVMTSLCRTSACGYGLESSITLEQAKELAESGKLESYIKPTETLFSELGYVKVTEAQSTRFSNGGALDIERTPLKKMKFEDNQIFRILNPENKFLGLGLAEKTSNQIKIYKLFK